MEIVTLILAAEEDELAAIGESAAPLNEWSGIEAPGWDTFKVATLHTLLTGDSLQMALDLYEPAYVSENETQVFRITDELLEQLASLDSDALDNIASELIATEAFEQDFLDADSMQDRLNELCELAQLAESQGQAMFVWIFVVQG